MDLLQVRKEIYDYEHSNFLGLRHQIADILKSPEQNKVNMIRNIYLNFSLRAFTRVAVPYKLFLLLRVS